MEKTKMSNNTKIHTERITLELPENVLQLVRATIPDPEKYLTSTIIQGINADLENDQVFRESLREKFKIA
jgi:hypothetical protein